MVGAPAFEAGDRGRVVGAVRRRAHGGERRSGQAMRDGRRGASAPHPTDRSAPDRAPQRPVEVHLAAAQSPVAAGRDAAGRTVGCRRRRRAAAAVWRLRRRPLARLAGGLTREDFDPFGELELGRRGVVPGEVEVVAAAVAGVAVVADPAEGRPRFVLDRLGPEGEAGDRRPVARRICELAVQRHDVDREAVVVVGVADVAVVAADVFAARQRAGVAVGDVDREALRRSSAGRGRCGGRPCRLLRAGSRPGSGRSCPARRRAGSAAGIGRVGRRRRRAAAQSEQRERRRRARARRCDEAMAHRRRYRPRRSGRCIRSRTLRPQLGLATPGRIGFARCRRSAKPASTSSAPTG